MEKQQDAALRSKLSDRIRLVPDFPKDGIMFRDITPVLQDPDLCAEMVAGMAQSLKSVKLDAVAGIESRGFFFGLLLAQQLRLPFVPVRKEGKLPFRKVRQEYELEYGVATIELHEDAFGHGAKVLVHDDLLATGGTAAAAAKMITGMGGEIAAFSFIVTLTALGGEARLKPYSEHVLSLVNY